MSYNYADSNFEFEDQNFGASLVVSEAGKTVSERVGLVVPAGIFGLSKHVLSTQAYYQIGRFDLQVIYKHRSRYFQQFISSPGLIRYIGDTGVVEARATYRLNDRVSFRVEGINLFDEPRKQYIPHAGQPVRAEQLRSPAIRGRSDQTLMDEAAALAALDVSNETLAHLEGLVEKMTHSTSNA